MRSPGRPPGWRREHRQGFWDAIAAGAKSEDAARAVRLSSAVGTRWFRESGGMRTVSRDPLSGRYLSFTDREEIAILKAQGEGVREIALRHRAPFDSATRGGMLTACVSASIRNVFRLTFRRFAAARTRRLSSTGSLPTIWMRPFISILQVWGRAGCPSTHDRSLAAGSRVES